MDILSIKAPSIISTKSKTKAVNPRNLSIKAKVVEGNLKASANGVLSIRVIGTKTNKISQITKNNIFLMWSHLDSNQGPLQCECNALTN
jgi:hypothetical protein